MKAGEIDLKKCSQPQFEMSVDAINFIKMYEFRQFTKELILGRTVTIEKNEDVYYRPALMTIEYDLDMADSFSMTFSNASKPGDTAMTFADLIKESSSTSRTVAANWSNLTDYTRHKETITDLIESPLNRTLRVAQENMAAQAFVIDDTGILGRKYDREFDSANGTFLDEQIRIIHNNILFTKDNWETASLALGKITLDEGITAYGLVADVLVGNLMLGSTMKLINSDGTILLDGKGITIQDSDGNDMFRASTSGGVYINGYATKSEQEDLAETLRQEFVAADGKLSSAISEILKAYSTTAEVKSMIEQTANSISLSVSEKFESYSTTEEVSGMIKLTAGEIKSTVESLEKTTDSINNTLTSITQRADSIEASVTDLTNDVTAKLELYVAKDDNDQIVSMLNASADEINLTANRLFIESDKFTLAKDGTITATAGKIGNLTLENGNLTSTNFRIETIMNTNDSTDNRVQSWLKFNNNNGESTTVVSDSDIFTPTLNTNNLLADTLYANKIGVNEGLSFAKKKINASDTYIELDSSPTEENYTATLEFSNAMAHLKVTTNKPLRSTKVFTVVYKVVWGSSYERAQIVVLAGSSVGQINVSAFWGIDTASFQLDDDMQGGGTKCTFKQLAGSSIIKVKGSILPSEDNKYALGDPGIRWKELNVVNTPIGSSDIKLKRDVSFIDNKYSRFFDRLQPRTYKWIDGKRTHIGFIAQEIKSALDECGISTMDYAGYCSWIDNSGDESCGIRISEIIPLCVKEIQYLKKEIAKIKSQK